MIDVTADDEPYAAQIGAALAVMDDDGASDTAHRSARARIQRLRARPLALGVGVFDFDALPAAAFRAHFAADTGRADPAGDAELVRRMANPLAAQPADLAETARLLNRPYVLLKENAELRDEASAEGLVPFHLARPVRYSLRKGGREVDDMFQAGDSDIVLFDEHTRRPAFYAQVAELQRARNYDAASGTLALRLRPI